MKNKQLISLHAHSSLEIVVYNERLSTLTFLQQNLSTLVNLKSIHLRISKDAENEALRISIVNLVSQLYTLPALTTLAITIDEIPNNPVCAQILQCLANQILQCLANQVFENLKVLDFRHLLVRSDQDFALVNTILYNNDILELALNIKFDSNVIRELYKSHLMQLSISTSSIKTIDNLLQILPLTYIHNLELTFSGKEDFNETAMKITNRGCGGYLGNHIDRFALKTSNPVYTHSRHNIRKCFEMAKDMIETMKNSSLYSNCEKWNVIPRIALITVPALFKKISFLLNHRYDSNLNQKDLKYLETHRGVLSRLAIPSLSQFLEFLGYKNSPKPLIAQLPIKAWESIKSHGTDDYLPTLTLSPTQTPFVAKQYQTHEI